MKRYRVLPLALNGKGNKIYRPGDIVTKENLHADPEELVRKKFLEEVKEDSEVETGSELDQSQLPSNEIQEFLNSNSQDDSTVSEKTIDDITKKEIIKDLKDRGVEFDENASKKDLFEIWKTK
jgi:hypothetical protein